MATSGYMMGRCKLPFHYQRDLEYFCNDCNRPLCGNCMILENHMQHHVLPHWEAIEGVKEAYNTEKESAIQVAGILQKQGTEFLTKKTDVKAEADKFEEAEMECVETIRQLYNEIYDHTNECEKHGAKVEELRREIERHQSEIKRHQSEIERHQSEIKRKHAEKERKRQDMKLQKEKLDQITKDKDTRMQTLDTKFHGDLEGMETAIKGLEARREAIKNTVAQGDSLMAEKVLRSGLHGDIEKIQKKLHVLADCARSVVDSRIGMPAYTSAVQDCSLELTLDDTVAVLGVSFATGDRIVIITNTQPSQYKRSTVMVWEWKRQGTPTTIVDQGDDLDSAYFGNERIVNLCNSSPMLRIIDLEGKVIRGIPVNLGDKTMGKLGWLAVDDRGNFLVTVTSEYGEHNLVLFSKDGEVIHDIDVRNTYVITFCGRRKMVVLCGNHSDTILCYKVLDDSLTEVMSASHGVEGFQCEDICSGNMGEIFIVGTVAGLGPWEVRLYQLDINEEKKQVKMRRIELSGAQLRSFLWPRCCVYDDKIVIGYEDKIKVYTLSY